MEMEDRHTAVQELLWVVIRVAFSDTKQRSWICLRVVPDGRGRPSLHYSLGRARVLLGWPKKTQGRKSGIASGSSLRFDQLESRLVGLGG